MYSQTFSLDELSRRCDLASYILSYWQMHFPQLRNPDGSFKSVFTINDEALVMRIKKLLYVDHLTIEDARERLQEERAFPVKSMTPTGVLNSQQAKPQAQPAPAPAPVAAEATPAPVQPEAASAPVQAEPTAAPAVPPQPEVETPAAAAPAVSAAAASKVLPTDLHNLMEDASRRAVAEALAQANQRHQQHLSDMKVRYDSLLNGAQERAQAAQAVADGKVAAAEEEVRQAQAAVAEAQARADKLIQEAQERSAAAEAAAQARMQAAIADAEERVRQSAEAAQQHIDEIVAQKNAEIERLQDACRAAADALKAMSAEA